MAKKYSIILATLVRLPEHIEMVRTCISAILNHSKDYELIIVDDASPQDTSFLKEYADVYIRHKKQGGCAKGWNDGLKKATGKYLVVISDDVTVRPGWLECMEKALKYFPKSLASMPAVEHMPVGSAMEERRTWIPASCFMLKRKALAIVGYFDEQFHPYNYEDVDYWTRVYKSGHTVARNYEVQVQHKEGQVIHSFDDNGTIDQKNREKYLKKWGFDPIPILYHGTAKFPWE